jgi:hypothetical protein
MRGIVADAEGRATDPGVLTSEQQQEFDRLKGEAEGLNTRAKNMEELAGLGAFEQREERKIGPGVDMTAAATSTARSPRRRSPSTWPSATAAAVSTRSPGPTSTARSSTRG